LDVVAHDALLNALQFSNTLWEINIQRTELILKERSKNGLTRCNFTFFCTLPTFYFITTIVNALPYK
jgi:hypothetical protein